MTSEGEFTYEIDGEKVKAVEEFYKKTNNKNYDLRINGLNITATSKSEPFFLDEIIVSSSFSPKIDKKQKENLELLRDAMMSSSNIYISLEDIAPIVNAETEKELRDIIEKRNTEQYVMNNTGGSVFEKVQDSTISNQNPLDAFNTITGHSTRHKAGTQISPLTYDGNKITFWGGIDEDSIINSLPKESQAIRAEDCPESLGRQMKRGKIIDYSKSGQKYNEGKPQLSIIFKQFPKALKAIAECSEYGNKKYKDTDLDFLNFKRVKGGSKNYADAGLRHRLETGLDESGLPHQFHIAWNAIAELQLWIEENE